MSISNKVMGRLMRYRALLTECFPKEKSNVFSYELASMMGLSASQVRRDFMCLGYSGVPRYGYEAAELVRHINKILDASRMHNAAVVGVGNLGRALITFLESRRVALKIVAAFDEDPNLAHKIINDIPCYPMAAVEDIIATEDVRIAILCVPGSAAQAVADHLVKAGIRGILNFAPVPIRLPENVVLEEVDVASALEKVAFYAGPHAGPPKRRRSLHRPLLGANARPLSS